MLTVGDRLPRFRLDRDRVPRARRGVPRDRERRAPRQVDRALLLADGLHVRLSDGRSPSSAAASRLSRARRARPRRVHRHALRPPRVAERHPELRDLPFPMLADTKRELSTALGILHKEDGVALRATFLVDPEGGSAGRASMTSTSAATWTRSSASSTRSRPASSALQLEEGRRDALRRRPGGVTPTARAYHGRS